jgi:hypothetical protein
MGAAQNNVTINQELPNTKEKGFSSVYRKKGVETLRKTPTNDIQNLNDLINHTVSKYGEKKGIGKTAIIKVMLR